jgi:hypothetical protein
MDSGVARPGFPRKAFDPLRLLLPEEICWIMDRMCAAEVCLLLSSSLHKLTLFRCFGILDNLCRNRYSLVYTYTRLDLVDCGREVEPHQSYFCCHKIVFDLWNW